MQDFGAVIDPVRRFGDETRCQMKEQVLPDRQCGTSVQ